ncbi:MAG TPA: hypothetical protein VFN57_06585 [Thermomicrobiaceae bacterium]|nr:hypothetical protein [Thermomicrobiaceae bacterium]
MPQIDLVILFLAAGYVRMAGWVGTGVVVRDGVTPNRAFPTASTDLIHRIAAPTMAVASADPCRSLLARERGSRVAATLWRPR